MLKYYKLQLAILCCVLLLNGMDLFVLYYPFQYSGKDKFTPRPNYSSWTVQRMERDLSRMSGCGISGILLCVTPDNLLNSHNLGLLELFLNEADKVNIKVAYVFTPETAMELSFSNVSNYLYSKGLTKNKTIFTLNGQPVLFFSEKVKLVDYDKAAFRYMQINLEYSNDSGLPFTRQYTLDSINMYHVFAGYSVKNGSTIKWKLPRKKGKTLAQQLKSLREINADITVISSWNDFYNGSAIEPNTLDNEAVLEAISQAAK